MADTIGSTQQGLTPTQKLDAAVRLYWTARELKAAGIRYTEPHLSEDAVQAKVRRIFLLMS